ncbi:STM4013/SEN3800 family hydrolase [Deinococcus sp. KNUC1210]|uniref:STM4013/SEN3800 family hydrolase n=1 Tax=Deinococcus sp. KNUC1210 TaxID=2917691 RepID=UPI001EEFB6EE|nr:STM4013/SEN3800 family hydrolase [Deinococcus sp. KNUC1210]ULH16178.1 STM4013/SEN3800 family hydrolase [Deinococcus sp. KNUC1210]
MNITAVTSVPELIGAADVVLITLDSLRFDVAVNALGEGRTPTLACLLPHGWDERHSPATFTFAAHQAFLSGFLPTPARPGRHPRLFAARFEGSRTTSPGTFVFDEAYLPHALAARGYATVCVGGVGFFNRRTPLGSVLPSLFQEAHWSPRTGVTSRTSAEAQVGRAVERLSAHADQRVFLFINFAATHHPTRIYDGSQRESPQSQQAALESIDAALPPLLDALSARGQALVILTADHGSTHGEDGYFGHRVAHPLVWTVPYAEFVLHGAATLPLPHS